MKNRFFTGQNLLASKTGTGLTTPGLVKPLDFPQAGIQPPFGGSGLARVGVTMKDEPAHDESGRNRWAAALPRIPSEDPHLLQHEGELVKRSFPR